MLPKFVLAATTALGLTCAFTTPTLAASSTTYSGIAETTIQYPNVYGTAIQQQIVRTQVACVMSSPTSAGGLTESNKFNLQIAPTTAGIAAQTGAISMWSAAASKTTTGNLLVQYWRYQAVDNTGNAFAGQLTNNATSLSLAFNLVNFPYLIPPNLEVAGYPYAMANGSKISIVASQGAGQLDVQISGKTTDLQHAFVSNIRCLI